jgi:hypothetical protein
VVPKLENSTLFQTVDKGTAISTASNGGLAVLGYINPNFNEDRTQKHGHLATFSKAQYSYSPGSLGSLNSINRINPKFLSNFKERNGDPVYKEVADWWNSLTPTQQAAYP